MPGAERVSTASDGTAAGLCVKRLFGCMEGVISASLHLQQARFALMDSACQIDSEMPHIEVSCLRVVNMLMYTAIPGM